jgi:hypothetical protein
VKIKEKLTTIFFACSLLATVGGENVRAFWVDAGASCNTSEAHSRCPTACAPDGGHWTSDVENSGWGCATNGNLKCDCELHRTFF